MPQQRFFSNTKQRFQRLNALAYSSNIAVKDNCLVTQSVIPAMSVLVAVGNVFFGNTTVPVAGGTLVLAASDPSNDRFDLIVVNSAGVLSVITGTPAVAPVATNYNPDTFLVLATVLVNDGVTQIFNADIEDNRVLFTISGAGGGGGGLGKFSQSLTAVTNITITHSLNDSKPIVQVYDSLNEQVTPDVIDVIDADNVNLQFSAPFTGFVIVHAGLGINVGSTAYYTQTFSSTTTVNVNHGLGLKEVHVSVYDNTDVLIEPQSVTLIDVNNLTIVFGSATAGKVVVSGGTTDVSVIGVKKFELVFVGQTTGFLVNHNLNTTAPVVQVYAEPDDDQVFPDIKVINANTVQLDFASSTSGVVIVIGGTQALSPGSGTADFLPNLNNTWDIGSGTFKWKDGYFAGKLNVAGGVDPSYIQLDPQGVEPDVGLNNKLWVDSADANKIKFKDNVGTNRFVTHSGNLGVGLTQTAGSFQVDVGTTANKIVQLDGLGKLPAVDGSNLTSLATGLTKTIINSSAEVTTVSTTYTSVKTISLSTVPLTHKIISVEVICDSKHSSGTYAVAAGFIGDTSVVNSQESVLIAFQNTNTVYATTPTVMIPPITIESTTANGLWGQPNPSAGDSVKYIPAASNTGINLTASGYSIVGPTGNIKIYAKVITAGTTSVKNVIINVYSMPVI